MNSRDIIEWTIDRVLQGGFDMIDDYQFNKKECIDKLVEELEKEF